MADELIDINTRFGYDPQSYRELLAAIKHLRLPGLLHTYSVASMPAVTELAVEAFEEDHVVFGTDGGLFHPGVAIGTIESADLSDEVKRKVYYRFSCPPAGGQENLL